MNWYLEVLRNYVKVLKNYATLRGRARRSEYWYFFLVNVIVEITLECVGGLAGVGYLANIYSLAVLVPGITVGVRRMHDVGKSGWFLLIPVYNLILAGTKGEQGINDYGADPKSEDDECYQ